jgi:membrane protein implicated in regulation of membrane protease activity
MMIITMALPILGLLFFFFLPFWTALPIYLGCLLFSGLMYYGMFSVMGGKRKVQAGVEKFIDEEAVVVEDLNPEGKVETRESRVSWNLAKRGNLPARSRFGEGRGEIFRG